MPFIDFAPFTDSAPFMDPALFVDPVPLTDPAPFMDPVHFTGRLTEKGGGGERTFSIYFFPDQQSGLHKGKRRYRQEFIDSNRNYNRNIALSVSLLLDLPIVL